jgi:small subunit ribosomal protein S2
MREITLQELLEAGCHFGHQVNRRNPKADEYIFEARSGVHIINLEKTHEGLVAAAEYVKSLAARGGSIIFVGNKRQAQTIVREEAARVKEAGVSNFYYVASRWIGGTFTNFSEVSKNFKKLSEIRELLKSRDRAGYTKREMVMFAKEEVKLDSFYGGIADMKSIPDAIFVIDTHLEQTAIREAREMNVTVIGMTDTNADPSQVNYPIPANDDAVGSIKVITEYLTDAWIEGSKQREADSVKREEEVKEKKEEKKVEEVREVKVESKKEKKAEAK